MTQFTNSQTQNATRQNVLNAD